MTLQDIFKDLKDKKKSVDAIKEILKNYLEENLKEYKLDDYDIDSLISRIMCVLCELAENYTSRAPFAEDNEYNKNVNKIKHPKEKKEFTFNHITLADTGRIVELGTVEHCGRSVGFAVDIDSVEVENSKNLLLSVERGVVQGTASGCGIANYCFPDCYDMLSSILDENRHYTPFVTVGNDYIENIIPIGRFDPYHVSKTNHPNSFTVYQGVEPRYSLYKKYFTEESPPPHIHFYTEEMCCGKKLLKENTDRAYRGNGISVAINLGYLFIYLSEIADALEKGQTDADILKEENSLGMPYLKQILSPEFKYDNSKFDAKRNTFMRLSLLKRIGLQFFGRESKVSQIRKLAEAFKFINDNKEKLTPEEQMELMGAIEEGLGNGKKIYKIKESKAEENSDDLENRGPAL